MGTPSAALSIQPPPNPVDQYSKLVALKSMMGQQQLQQQQVQGAQIQNQENALQLQSQRAFMAAFSKPINWNDPNAIQGVMQTAAQNGATPQALMSFNQMLLQQRQGYANLDKTQLGIQQQHNDMLRGTLTSIINANPAQKASMWNAAVDDAVKRGIIQPGSITDQYPGDQMAMVLANHLALGSQLATEAAASQRAQAATSQAATAAARLTAQAPGIAAQNTVAQQAAQLGPQGLAAARAAGTAQGQLSTAQPLAAAKAAGTFQGQMQAMDNLSGIAGGLAGAQAAAAPAQAPGAPAAAPTQGVPLQAPALPGTLSGGQLVGRNPQVLQQIAAKNPGLAATVRALDEGRYQIPSAFALRSPYWQQVMNLVSAYDPSFDAVNYAARARTREDFTSGTAATQVNALNTAIGHLAQLSQAANALHNGSWTPVNTLKNWLSQKSGNPEVTNFQTVVKPVADELTRVWRGTGGSEADIENRLNALSSSNSPEQLHGAIRQLGELMRSKIVALQNQYQQGMGVTGVNMLTPEAQQTLNMLEGKGAAGAPARPTIVGPGGHTLVLSPDGKSWVSPGGGQ